MTSNWLIDLLSKAAYNMTGPLHLPKKAAHNIEWALLKKLQIYGMGPVWLPKMVANNMGWANHSCLKILPIISNEPTAPA